MQSIRPQSLAEIDVRANELARMCLAGQIGDLQARERFAELIMRARVAHDVARSRAVRSRSDWDDLEDAVSEQLTVKAFTAAADGGLDVERIASGASLSGWARQLGKRIASSKHRDLRSAALRQIPFDTQAGPEVPTPFEHLSVSIPAAERRSREDRDLAVLSAYLDASAAARDDAATLRVQARTLRTMFDLPAAVAPRDLLARHDARKAVAAEASAALDALRTRGTPFQDDLLSPMWDPCGPHETQTLEELSDSMGYASAQLLLNEVLVAEARPPAISVLALKTHVASWHRGSDWAAATARLVESYLAVTCAAQSPGDRRTASAGLEQTLRGRERDARDWPAALADLLAVFPSNALGDDDLAVARTLAGLLDHVLDDPGAFAVTEP